MDANILREIVSNIGFPISCVLCLGWYIQQRDKQQTEDRKQERETMLEEIKFSRQVNQSLLDTNKILSSDIKVELQDIKNELKHIAKEE